MSLLCICYLCPLYRCSFCHFSVRSIIPAVILQQVEQIIRSTTQNGKANLIDYFDLICGTSAGGILTISKLSFVLPAL